MGSFGSTAMTTLVLLAKRGMAVSLADARNSQLATHEHCSCVHFTCSMPAPTKAGLACLSGSSSAGGRVAGRVVLNWTRSFEKSRSSVQSKATRTFFSNRGSFSK